MNEFTLNKDIALNAGCAYIKSIGTLVIGDLHIGYEESMHKFGVLIPSLQYNEMFAVIKKLISFYEPKKIVLLGDVQHEFTKPKYSVNKKIRNLLNFLNKNSELIIIKGNHEKLLQNTLQKFKTQTYYYFKNYFFCHGDKVFNNEKLKKAKTIIIGHEHPALILNDSTRQERFKSYLYGKYKNKNLLILPSLNQLRTGSDIINEGFLGVYAKNISNALVYVFGKQIYDFGSLTELKKKLD